jgi:hypothetical protein
MAAPLYNIGFIINNGINYKIADLQYPDDLDTSEQYGQNRVVFFINVTGESKLRKDDPKDSVADIPPSEYRVTAGRKAVETTATATGIGTAPAFNSTLPMKRLTAAISLYIPNDLNTSYNVMWGDEEKLAGSGVFLQTGANAAGGKAGFMNSAATAIGAATTGAATKAAQEALQSKDLQKVTRTNQNTKKEQLFQGVEFRNINFSFQFAPKNIKEAENVLNIIRTFRHHMLPEFADENQFIYIYPSEFEIKYFKNDQESEFLERHFTAVLISCNINYTPNGQFVTFENGMPSQINMTLQFKEMYLPSKESSSNKAPGK